jgi:hypothetical protein
MILFENFFYKNGEIIRGTLIKFLVGQKHKVERIIRKIFSFFQAWRGNCLPLTPPLGAGLSNKDVVDRHKVGRHFSGTSHF